MSCAVSLFLWSQYYSFQVCICSNRILVQDEIYDEFAKKMAEKVDKELKVGNGMEQGITQGPLINDKAVEKASQLVVITFLC